MHAIEPFYKWRERYIASEDRKSPFYRRTYSEFEFTNKVYNFLIHPQWEDIESNTLCLKVLYADYEDSFGIIEFIGEWNDVIENDILTLRKEVFDRMMEKGIYKFVLIGENILNFHGDSDDYYEEWLEEINEESGWVACINFQDHVLDEMRQQRLHQYLHFGGAFNEINWRRFEPDMLFDYVQSLVDRYAGKMLV
jgi:hypothetical protein